MWLSTFGIFRMIYKKKKTRILYFVSSRNRHFNINACGGKKKNILNRGGKKYYFSGFERNTNATVVVYQFRTIFLRTEFQFIQNRNQIKAHGFGNRRLCLSIVASRLAATVSLVVSKRPNVLNEINHYPLKVLGEYTLWLPYRVTPKEHEEHWWFKQIWKTIIIF